MMHHPAGKSTRKSKGKRQKAKGKSEDGGPRESLSFIFAFCLLPFDLFVEHHLALDDHVGYAALSNPVVAVGVVFVAVVCDDARAELVGELDDEEVGVRAGGHLSDLLRLYERFELRLVVYVVLEARVNEYERLEAALLKLAPDFEEVRELRLAARAPLLIGHVRAVNDDHVFAARHAFRSPGCEM